MDAPVRNLPEVGLGGLPAVAGKAAIEVETAPNTEHAPRSNRSLSMSGLKNEEVRKRAGSLADRAPEGSVLKSTSNLINHKTAAVGALAVFAKTNGNLAPEIAKFLSQPQASSDIRQLLTELKSRVKSDDDIINFATGMISKTAVCVEFVKSVAKNPDHFVSLVMKFGPAHTDFAVTMLIHNSGKTPDQLCEIALKEYDGGNKTMALTLADNLLRQRETPSSKALEFLGKIAVKEYTSGSKPLAAQLSENLLRDNLKAKPPETFTHRLGNIVVDHKLGQLSSLGSDKTALVRDLAKMPEILMDQLKTKSLSLTAMIAGECKLNGINMPKDHLQALEKKVIERLRVLENELPRDFESLKNVVNDLRNNPNTGNEREAARLDWGLAAKKNEWLDLLAPFYEVEDPTSTKGSKEDLHLNFSSNAITTAFNKEVENFSSDNHNLLTNCKKQYPRSTFGL